MSDSNLRKLTQEFEAERWKKLEEQKQRDMAKFTKYACYYTDNKPKSFDISPAQRYLRQFNEDYASMAKHRLESVYDSSIVVEGDDFDDMIPIFREMVNDKVTIDMIIEHRRK